MQFNDRCAESYEAAIFLHLLTCNEGLDLLQIQMRLGSLLINLIKSGMIEDRQVAGVSRYVSNHIQRHLAAALGKSLSAERQVMTLERKMKSPFLSCYR